jgi:hypothetical protein
VKLVMSCWCWKKYSDFREFWISDSQIRDAQPIFIRNLGSCLDSGQFTDPHSFNEGRKGMLKETLSTICQVCTMNFPLSLLQWYLCPLGWVTVLGTGNAHIFGSTFTLPPSQQYHKLPTKAWDPYKSGN